MDELKEIVTLNMDFETAGKIGLFEFLKSKGYAAALRAASTHASAPGRVTLTVEQVKASMPATSVTQSDDEWWELVTERLNAHLQRESQPLSAHLDGLIDQVLMSYGAGLSRSKLREICEKWLAAQAEAGRPTAISSMENQPVAPRLGIPPRYEALAVPTAPLGTCRWSPEPHPYEETCVDWKAVPAAPLPREQESARELATWFAKKYMEPRRAPTYSLVEMEERFENALVAAERAGIEKGLERAAQECEELNNTCTQQGDSAEAYGCRQASRAIRALALAARKETP